MREISPKTPAAFTLIELLVVVAIISVLATLAMVNYQGSVARARTSRAHADMRTLTLGLESYYVDYNDYPPNPAIPVLGPQAVSKSSSIQPRGFNISPFHVTTPVAYISSIPRDPFREGIRNVYDIYNSSYDDQRFYYSYYRIMDREDWTAVVRRGGETISLIAVDANRPNADHMPGFAHYLNRGAFRKYGQWVQWGAGPDGVIWNPEEDFVIPGDPLNALLEPQYKPWGYSFDVPYDPTNGTASFGNIIRTQLGGPRPAYSTTYGQDIENSGGPSGGDDPAGGAPRIHRIPASRGNVTLNPEKNPSQRNTSDDLLLETADREFKDLVESKAETKPFAHRPWWAFLLLLPSWLWLLLLLLLLILFLAWLAWYMSRHRRLENRIAMSSATFSDSDFLRFKGIKGVKNLQLAHSLVTDEGMKHISRCTLLESLNLWGTSIGNPSLEPIKSLPCLKELVLSETKVTDTGLPQLAAMISLENLVLTGLSITDAGLLHLRGMTGLKYLNLRSTLVTAGGVAAFMKARPGCEVAHSLELPPDTSGRNA